MQIPSAGPNPAPNERIWGSGPAPAMEGPPLPADNPFVIGFSNMFHMPIGMAQLYAGRFQQNMMQMIGNEIKRCQEQAKKAADDWKQAIEEQ